MKNLKRLSITLPIILASCGGSSSNSNDVGNYQLLNEPSYELLTAAPPPSGELADGFDPSKCGDKYVVNSDVFGITGDSRDYQMNTRSDNATVSISGENNGLCVNGNLSLLTIRGINHRVYVNGSIGSLNVMGYNSSVVVFGGVGAGKIIGTNTAIWASNIGVFDDVGWGTDYKTISDYLENQ